MRIPIRVGIDFFGHLHQEDGSALATRCFFINYLPVVPLGTYRLAGERAAPAAFSFKSLFAALFKAWGFLIAGGLAAYGLAWGSWGRHRELPVITALAGVLFLGVYASWLFLGHRARTGLRWGMVSGFAAVTVAVFAYGVGSNFSALAQPRSYPGEQLPPADMPMTISVLKNLPDGPKPGELRAVGGEPLRKGQQVLVDLPSGVAAGSVVVATSDDLVSITTARGGSTVYKVGRDRLYLGK